MLFSTLEYLIFFLIYYSLFRLLGSKWHLHLIVVGSLIFYGWWNPYLAWVPGLLCSLAYIGVLWFEGTDNLGQRKTRLLLTISSLLAPLIYFKYNDFFFNEMISPVFNLPHIDLKVALPLGISFITFTMISYVVDVYRKRFPAEKSLFHIFAYTLFFPQLIAGPILRPSELIPQLLRGNSRKLSSIGLGLTVFTVGLAKKLIFADSIGTIIDPVFAAPEGLSAPTYWLAMLGFTLQIYCDFSGYTDMAIGSAIILGVRLPINFAQPYAAVNLQEFWKRWHITLSKWLRDYLYIPLGGSRSSKPRHLTNILVTMVLGGLWHGANWTFLVWGAAHGLGIIVVHSIHYSPTATRISKMVPRFFKWAITLLFVIVTWVFFRADNVPTALTIIKGSLVGPLTLDDNFLGLHAFSLILLCLFAISHGFDSLRNIRFAYRKSNKTILSVTLVMVWLLAIAVSTGSSQKFIYFDF